MSDDYGTEPFELPPCPVCHDRATWAAWDFPEWATPVFCDGCGGLLTFTYDD